MHFELRGGTLSRLFGRDTGTIKAVDGVNLDAARRARCSAWSARAAAASPRWAGRCSVWCPRRRARSACATQNIADLSRRRLREIRQRGPDGLPGPERRAQPVDDRRGGGGATRCGSTACRSATERRTRVVEALERVGLSPVELFLTKYPRDLSGGQKQRVVIARAIVLQPELLVADEPVSMLDMSVRAKILQLMLDLKQDLGLTYVYITHDLATAKFFCDRIAIMYLGRIVEIGPTEEIFADPRHPYTKALLAAIPEPDPDKAVPRDLPRGEIPDAARPPLGCAFHPRCPEAVSGCGWESRDLRALVEEHWMRGGRGVRRGAAR